MKYYNNNINEDEEYIMGVNEPEVMEDLYIQQQHKIILDTPESTMDDLEVTRQAREMMQWVLRHPALDKYTTMMVYIYTCLEFNAATISKALEISVQTVSLNLYILGLVHSMFYKENNLKPPREYSYIMDKLSDDNIKNIIDLKKKKLTNKAIHKALGLPLTLISFICLHYGHIEEEEYVV